MRSARTDCATVTGAWRERAHMGRRGSGQERALLWCRPSASRATRERKVALDENGEATRSTRRRLGRADRARFDGADGVRDAGGRGLGVEGGGGGRDDRRR